MFSTPWKKSITSSNRLESKETNKIKVFPNPAFDYINPHCAESPILAMKKNIFDKFQPILG